MRLGRIVLAGLAPLFGLSALAAEAPITVAPQTASPEALTGLFRSAIPAVIPASEFSLAAPSHAPRFSGAFFAIESPVFLAPGWSILPGGGKAAPLLVRSERHLLLRC